MKDRGTVLMLAGYFVWLGLYAEAELDQRSGQGLSPTAAMWFSRVGCAVALATVVVAFVWNDRSRHS